MEFVLEPESTESLQATLAFIDETLDDASPIRSHSPNAQAQSPDSDDWETSHLLDDFPTDISSDASSPGVAADLAIPAVPTPSSRNVTFLLAPEAQHFGSSNLLSAISTPQQPIRKKRRNYNPNKAREDLQRELTYLRSEADELEVKLHQLQSLKVAKTKDGSSVRQLATQPVDSRTPFVWEQTCARQLECRLRSERENAHLKMLLEGQIQVAKSLEKLLNKRTTLYPSESSGSKQTTRVHVSRTGNEVADAVVFEELADGVDASYREVERVFASSGLELSNVSSRKAQMRDAKTGMFLEIFDSKVLPFSMHATGEAWWRRWNHFNPNRGSCHRLESTDDTIVEHFGMEMSDSKAKTSAKFYVQQILRRYIEENRVVVVWQSHIEPLEFSHKKLAGIRFREKGYVVIKPHQVSQDETYTLVQTCHIIKPDLSDQRLKKDARTGALAEFVLSATVANIAASAEMIEGLLVDEALQQRSRI
ncbi:hypothetical protein F444_18670 [Phytophthora nicotianae P1976]|uniref:M96 mating-specific protein family n=1 Tax=Phytophthora nicotianae P1976 TaxID=1317066 RepID=A0A080ZAJ7_PHYNI|nr:hypothetical protein F444_18670 [Phytophthora nicotianae P1976]